MESQSDGISTFGALWQKLALGLISLLVAGLFLVYQGVSSDLKETQAQVAVLQTQKVDRADLRETESRLNNKIDAAFSNLVSRSAADKQDILQRLDLYFSTLKKR